MPTKTVRVLVEVEAPESMPSGRVAAAVEELLGRGVDWYADQKELQAEPGYDGVRADAADLEVSSVALAPNP